MESFFQPQEDVFEDHLNRWPIFDDCSEVKERELSDYCD